MKRYIRANTEKPFIYDGHQKVPKDVTEVIVADGITKIRSFAFSSCILLERIKLPDSVTYIDYCAFSNCQSLTTITVSNAAIRIHPEAFYNCDSLAQIILPDEVIDLGGSRNNMSDEAEPGSFAYKQKQLEEFEIDWDDIEDDFYQDFCDAAYQIVENEGYTDVFTEPSTQSGVGGDFFTAYLNGERYSGSFNFVDEQDCLEEIYLNSDSYEEACDRAAKWYAQVILDNLELDEE